MATAERKRYQALHAVSVEFDAPGMLETWVANGVSAEDARAGRAENRAERERHDAAGRITLDPAGAVTNHAARVELVTRHWFNRPDVADTLPPGARVQFNGDNRDVLARIRGLKPTGGADPSHLFGLAIDEERGAGILSYGSRLVLGMGTAAGASTTGGISVAVRDSLDQILQHDWMASGAFWRGACREVESRDFRPRRFWVTSSGSGAVGIVGGNVSESGAGEVVSHDAGTGGWLQIDLQVRHRYFEDSMSLTVESVVNEGAAILSAWMAARVANWHHAADREVEALLGGASVDVSSGALDAAHFSAAVAQLNRQEIAGLPLGSTLPVAIAGEGRRGLLSAVPSVQRAEGDQTAVLSRIEYSASVAADFGPVLIHPGCMPAALGRIRGSELTPRVAIGDGGGSDSPMGRRAVAWQDRSAPALVQNAAGETIGAVRMVMV